MGMQLDEFVRLKRKLREREVVVPILFLFSSEREREREVVVPILFFFSWERERDCSCGFLFVFVRRWGVFDRFQMLAHWRHLIVLETTWLLVAGGFLWIKCPKGCRMSNGNFTAAACIYTMNELGNVSVTMTTKASSGWPVSTLLSVSIGVHLGNFLFYNCYPLMLEFLWKMLFQDGL